MTLVEVLQAHAENRPKQRAFTFLVDGEADEDTISYAALDRRARNFAAQLQMRGGQLGDHALLMYPPGIEFIAAYFGCLYAGVIAIPLQPPKINRMLPRIIAVAQDAGAKIILSEESTLVKFQDRVQEVPELANVIWLTTNSKVNQAGFTPVPVTVDTIAFLQYTSGSTGTPKGVMVTHGNLIHNQGIILEANRGSPDDTSLSWLPVYHDMGLIGHIIQPLYVGGHSVLMPPIAFLQRPARWLEAITKYGVTHSGGPNFAFDLCVRKITEAERASLDLSTWRVAYTGAEPIRAETLDRFTERFSSYGFDRNALMPSYGLAEATLLVTAADADTFPNRVTLARRKFEQGQVDVISEDADSNATLTLVSVGRIAGNQTVKIVDPDTLMLCPPNEIGEVWVKGGSVAQGYWKNPESTEATFGAYTADTDEGPFLRTGDLGFMHNDELYIAGRLKAMLIIRGQNYYSEDIEQTVAGSHPAIEPSAVAAFSVDADDSEQLVITCELERSQRKTDPQEVMESIRRNVFDVYGIPVYSVALLLPASIPRTTSGKVQRYLCKENFLNNSLKVIKADFLRQHGQDANIEYVAPRTATEEIVVNIWQNVLNVPQVGVHHDFFQLGGQSLGAMQVIVRLRDAFGIELSLRSLFESPTPAVIAELLDQQQGKAVKLPPIEVIPRDGVLPLSYSQERMWFLYQLEPSSLAYNVETPLRLDGPANLDAFEKAFEEIIRRHEGLRSTFEFIDGDLTQVIHPTMPRSINMTSVEMLPEGEREHAAKRKLQELNHQPFDIENGPLMRVNIIRIDERSHLLGLVMHHIISDAWSISVLARELALLYENYAYDEEVELPTLDVQMADFANWQRTWVQEDILDDQLTYWKQQLADVPDILELPSDRPRPPVQTYNGGQINIDLPAELLDQLRLLSQQEGATLYMTLLAAFNILLHNYTSQDDILVASPIANRQVLSAEDLIGTFVNTLAMRTDLSGDPTFQELLHRVRVTAIEAYANQDFPFEQLVQQLQPVRDLSRSPLVQVMFTLANTPLTPHKMREIEWDVITDIDIPASQLDLTLMMVDIPGAHYTSIIYNTDLFDAITIERMGKHFTLLLENIIKNPKGRLSELSLLPKYEEDLLLAEWNNTFSDFPEDQCLHQLIEAQVERTPNNIAVIYGEKTLTYRELNRRANRLAHHLLSLGVSPGMLVGIHIERSFEMLIAVLAVEKAGGAYVPLDPAFPRERLNLIVEDSQIHVLLTHSELGDSIPKHKAHVLYVDRDRASIARNPDTNPTSAVSPHDLVYVIFTSGSTGRPKGVQLEHLSVVNFLSAMSKQPGLTADDVLLAVTTLSFDIAVLELYLPLIMGAKVLIASREESLSGSRLIQMIDENSVTVMQATPATWQVMLEAGWEGTHNLKALCGGEALPLELAEKLIERTSALWNMYGPTETTVWSTTYHVKDTQDGVLIGRPIDNTTIYILDKYQRPAPVGVPGELLIGGDGLARGYFNRPDLTNEKFIPDPFINREGARLYKTGDVVRYLPDGNIQFYGRIDNQVKVRGFRIELGEIETVLGRYPDVKQNVVIVREDQPGNKALVAYLATKSGKKIPVSKIREFVSKTLPQYMVPSVFMHVDELPLTPNGKINRRALPAPDFSSMDLSTKYVKPRSKTEKALAKIWQDALGVPRVGVRDNFFDLGGHSLLAARIFTQIEKSFGQNLPLATLFRTPTIQQLADLLEDDEDSDIVADLWSPVVPIQPEGHRSPFFCVGGGVVNMQMLGKYLGEDIPFYALQTQGLDARLLMRADIPAMADQMIGEMRKIQPEGPYYLGGAYGSAMVTLEMANQLRKQGEDVGVLVAFNLLPQHKSSAIYERVLRVVSIDGESVAAQWFKLPLYLMNKLTNLSWLHLVEYLMEKFWRVAYVVFRWFNQPMPRMLRGGLYVEALLTYAAHDVEFEEMYHHPVNLIISDLWFEMYDVMQPNWGWDTLVDSDIHSHRVPGDPCTMFMDPNVEVLAQELRQILLAAYSGDFDDSLP